MVGFVLSWVMMSEILSTRFKVEGTIGITGVRGEEDGYCGVGTLGIKYSCLNCVDRVGD